jgi:hypothetical protein
MGLGVRVFAPSATAAWVIFYDEATGLAGRFEVPLVHVGSGTWELMLTGVWAGKALPVSIPLAQTM